MHATARAKPTQSWGQVPMLLLLLVLVLLHQLLLT
jgi:hypothetical protein